MDNIATSEQRKLEFENTLLELMQEIPYSRIAVKDLTDRMGLVRKTFYHYFSGKDACLQSLTDRLILECSMEILRALPGEAPSLQICQRQLQFWMDHRTFLQAILDNGLNAYFVDRYLAYIRREDLPVAEQLHAEELACDGDILFFFMTGQIALLLKWCSEGFRLPPEEMARKNLRLTHTPLFRQT
jgi:AcrR family transcriptional regulator